MKRCLPFQKRFHFKDNGVATSLLCNLTELKWTQHLLNSAPCQCQSKCIIHVLPQPSWKRQTARSCVWPMGQMVWTFEGRWRVNGIDWKGNPVTGGCFVMFTLLATALNSDTFFDWIHVIVDLSPSRITPLLDSTWNAVQVCNRPSVSSCLRKTFGQGHTVATIQIFGKSHN